MIKICDKNMFYATVVRTLSERDWRKIERVSDEKGIFYEVGAKISNRI